MTSGKRAVIYLRVSTERQVNTWINTDGISLSAQEDLCTLKAEQLGADVVEIYKEKGETAKKREGRHQLARLLTDIKEDPVDYVIVFKLDRLARNTVDDAEMSEEILSTGARLISVSEEFDDTTTNGWLMHRMLAVFAEHEIRVSGDRVSMGMEQKARLGGTPGVPAIGYLNHREAVVGGRNRGVATVVVDEERATHVRWAFDAYATGEWSIGRLVDELDERGLRSRPRRRTGVPIPLKKKAVHQMLRNKYYIGIVTYKGDEYEGVHEPLIDADLFDRVQDLLSSRRNSHTKYRVHDHFLKGSIYCRRCNQRFYYRQVTNRHGSTYEYFLCRGRNSGEGCETPHLSIEMVEDKIAEVYGQVFLSSNRLRRLREVLRYEATKHDEDRERVIAAQEARLTRLLGEEQKNRIAYQADALSLEVLKLEKDRITKERADARKIINRASARYDDIVSVIEQAIHLADNWTAAYRSAPDRVRRLMNQVFFNRLLIDEDEGVDLEYSEPYQRLLDVDEELERITREAEPLFGREPLTVEEMFGTKRKNPDLAFAGQGSQMMLLVGVEVLWFKT